MVRISPDVAVAINDPVTEDYADLVVLGWKGHSKNKQNMVGSVLDVVLKTTPANIAIVRPREMVDVKKILLLTRGGPNARLAAELSVDIARTTGAHLTAAIVVSPGLNENENRTKLGIIDKTVEGIGLDGIQFEKKTIVARSVLKGILEESAGYDLVMIGATREPIWKRLFLGTIPKSVARSSPKTVMMVKRYEGSVKSWFKKLLSG